MRSNSPRGTGFQKLRFKGLKFIWSNPFQQPETPPTLWQRALDFLQDSPLPGKRLYCIELESDPFSSASSGLLKIR